MLTALGKNLTAIVNSTKYATDSVVGDTRYVSGGRGGRINHIPVS